MTGIDGPYTLPEVAAMTGISLRSIERGCRNGTIEHIPIGDGTARQHRRMYRHHIDLLIEQRSRRSVKPAPSVSTPDDDVAAAIEASRKLHSRRTGRRAA